jgi:hypothetical protein
MEWDIGHLNQNGLLRFTIYKYPETLRICDALRLDRRPLVARRMRVCSKADAERLCHLRAT